MTRLFRDLSVKGKLKVISMLNSGVALLVACAVMATLDYASARRGVIEDACVHTEIVAGNSAAAVAFDDSDAANGTLALLRPEPSIREAYLHDSGGLLVGTYTRDKAVAPGEAPAAPPDTGFYHFLPSGDLEVVRPVLLNGAGVGTVILRHDMGDLRARVHLTRWCSLRCCSSRRCRSGPREPGASSTRSWPLPRQDATLPIDRPAEEVLVVDADDPPARAAEERLERLAAELDRTGVGRPGRLDGRLLAVLGGALVPIGIGLVVLGWVGASHTSNVYEQVPYLISGAQLGQTLAIVGALGFFAHWLTVLVREHRLQTREIVAALDRLQATLASGANGALSRSSKVRSSSPSL